MGIVITTTWDIPTGYKYTMENIDMIVIQDENKYFDFSNELIS